MININYKVYIHKNLINDKKYIGITKQNPKRRWNNGNGYKHNFYFYRAIKKYGWSNFEHLILFDNLAKEEAEQIEIELITYHKSTNPKFGYNIESGGNVGKILTENTKRKISLSQKGLQSGEKNPRAVTIYCIETGEKFTTFKDAGAKYNITTSHIKDACLDYNKTRANLHWAYEKDYLAMTEEDKNKIIKNVRKIDSKYNPSSKRIMCIETNEVFDCIKDVVNKYNISRTSICNYLKGKTKTCKNYHWKIINKKEN